MSAASASTITLSFSWAASSLRRPAFSSSASSSSVMTLAIVWMTYCHDFRSAHSGALTSQAMMISTQNRKNEDRLTRR